MMLNPFRSMMTSLAVILMAVVFASDTVRLPDKR
jgi:hypothetical protein